ncbi:MAG: hypothetical protein PHY28_06360 [Dehalococcoidales bacterium]|nr:hypothetical protein [Dehalococcoidales bacterium]
MERKATLVEKQSHKITYAIPVTLREVEAFEIPIDSTISVDDTGHQKLMDDTGILRIAFGTAIDGLKINDFAEIQCLNATASDPKPKWRNCLSRLLHAFGNVMLSENTKREHRIRKLLAHVLPNYNDIIIETRKPFEEYVKKYKLTHPDEFENEN